MKPALRIVSRWQLFLTVFLVVGVTYAIVMAMVPQVDLPSAALRGGMFGLFMATVLVLMHVVMAGRRTGHGTVAVHQSATCVLPGPVASAERTALLALEGLRRRVTRTEQGGRIRLRLRTRLSMRSWGEVVSITLSPGDGTSVRADVESRPWFPLTVVDYGTNADNLERVVTRLGAEAEPLRPDAEPLRPDAAG